MEGHAAKVSPASSGFSIDFEQRQRVVSWSLECGADLTLVSYCSRPMAAGRVPGVSRLLSLHTRPTVSADGFRLEAARVLALAL